MSQYLPTGPYPHLSAAAPFLPPPLSHLTPALETLAGSRALTALAQAQKRLREEEADTNSEIKPSKKCRRIDNANNAAEDPLDLSSNATTIEDDVDVLSIDPPSPSNVEHWSIDKVADFVSNVESCREYAQVCHFPFFRNFWRCSRLKTLK